MPDFINNKIVGSNFLNSNNICFIFNPFPRYVYVPNIKDIKYILT